MLGYIRPPAKPAGGAPPASGGAPSTFAMPELPEVETTRRGIASGALGKRVAAVHVYDGRLRWPVPANLADELVGRTLHTIERRSKYLLIGTGGAGTLLVHLGMTGSLRLQPDETPRRRHDHVDIVLDDGSRLRYHDPRRFGAMLWIAGDPHEHPLLSGLGPEPLTPAFDAGYLHARTRGRRAAIKASLMDARIVVGVGNIYASEALFRAGIRPGTASGRLSRARLALLVDAVREVLEEAIASGGSTLRDYVDPEGARGRFQLTHRVYGRAGLPCLACGTPIRAVRIGQRSTFYCPRCQAR